MPVKLMIYAFFIRVKEVQGLRCFVSELFVDFSTVDADDLGEHILLFEHLFKISVFKRSKDIRQDRLRVFTVIKTEIKVNKLGRGSSLILGILLELQMLFKTVKIKFVHVYFPRLVLALHALCSVQCILIVV